MHGCTRLHARLPHFHSSFSFPRGKAPLKGFQISPEEKPAKTPAFQAFFTGTKDRVHEGDAEVWRKCEAASLGPPLVRIPGRSVEGGQIEM